MIKKYVLHNLLHKINFFKLLINIENIFNKLDNKMQKDMPNIRQNVVQFMDKYKNINNIQKVYQK